MKKTLKTRFGTEIQDILPRDALTQETYKTKLKSIHTAEVAKDIRNNGTIQYLMHPHQKSTRQRKNYLGELDQLFLSLDQDIVPT